MSNSICTMLLHLTHHFFDLCHLRRGMDANLDLRKHCILAWLRTMNQMEMFSEEMGLLRFSQCWREGRISRKNLIPNRSSIGNNTHEGDIIDVGQKFYNRIPKEIREAKPLQNQSREQLCKYKGKKITKWFKTEMKVASFEEAERSYFDRAKNEARNQAKERAKKHRLAVREAVKKLSGNTLANNQRQ